MDDTRLSDACIGEDLGALGAYGYRADGWVGAARGWYDGGDTRTSDYAVDERRHADLGCRKKTIEFKCLIVLA